MCVERPYRMQMRYNGGGCYGTNFRRCPGENPDACTCTKEELPCSAWSNKNTCEDFDINGNTCNTIDAFCLNQADKSPTPGCGPPAKDIDHEVYIEAFGKEELYFSGPVRVNTTWDAVSSGEKVEANTDIFTYEWIEGVGKGRLLQHVVFHSSCSQELFLTDQFGAQQLLEFDSFCPVSCSDPSCIEVSENGVTFGRRRISLFLENVADLSLQFQTGSPTGSVELDQVLGLLIPTDLSSIPQLFNFSDVRGVVVPPPVTLTPVNLLVNVETEYDIGAIVTGFLAGNRNAPCEQVGQSTLICEKVESLPCDCPPCGPIEDGGGGGDKKPKKAATIPSLDFEV